MDLVGRLLLFRSIVDRGSLSAAARQWGLNHSTVSRHLKNLEAELQTLLLVRTSRTLSLTEEGRIAYEQITKIGDRVDELTRLLEERRAQVGGELKLTCLIHLFPLFVQPALRKFQAKYPHVRVSLVLNDGPLSFQQGGFDLALRVGLPSELSLTAQKLADNPVCLAATRGLLRKHGPLKHPRDLAHYPTVAYAGAEVDIVSWRYIDEGRVQSVRVQPCASVNEGNSLLALVRDGVGVGYLSRLSAQEDLRRGKLLEVLPEFELPTYDPIYLITRQSELVAPRIAAFRNELLSVGQALAD